MKMPRLDGRSNRDCGICLMYEGGCKMEEGLSELWIYGGIGVNNVGL